MRWVFALGFVLATVVAIVWYSSPSYVSRFRLTIDVDTPDGIKSGSSVIETKSWESTWGTLETRGMRSRAWGQAIYVDLGNGKNLVGLLGRGPAGKDTDAIYGLNGAALSPPGTHLDWKKGAELKGKGDLPSAYIPTLITFTNLNDPKTARLVDSAQLASVFGPGFSLRRVFLETTNDAVTYDIDRKLPWWNAPGRPAEVAWLSFTSGYSVGSIGPEDLFLRK